MITWALIKQRRKEIGVLIVVICYFSFVLSASLTIGSRLKRPPVPFLASSTTNQNLIIPLSIKVNKVDGTVPSASLALSVDYANLPPSYKTPPNRLAQSFRVLIEGNEIIFAQDTIPETATIVLGGSGSIVYYPFDSYTFQFDIEISEQMYPNNFYDGTIDFNINMNYDVLGFNCLFASLKEDEARGSKTIQVSVYHTPTFLVYPLFILFGLAGYGVSIGCVGYYVLFKPQAATDSFKFLPPLGTLLFAVPKIRTDMPFSPPIGSLMDYVVFYWVQVSLVTTFIIIVCRQIDLILKTNKTQEASKPPPPPVVLEMGITSASQAKAMFSDASPKDKELTSKI